MKSISPFIALCASLVTGLVLLPLIIFSQTELDERALIEVGDAITIKKQEDFLLNLRFRMQNRLAYFSVSDSDLSPDRFEARVRRLRLRFDGYLVDSRFQYYIQLSFSRSDQDLDRGVIPQVVRDAMVYYFFDSDTYIGFGQGKLPGNRQRVISSGSLQFADRSIANANFTIDRDFGLFGYHTIHLGRSELILKAAVTTGDGRNAPATNNGLAYTGRVEFLPFGAFTSNGDFLEGDLYREPSPKMSLGIASSFNHKATRANGQTGIAIMEERDITSFMVDMMIKYNGWALLGEYIQKDVDDAVFTGLPENSDFPEFMLSGWGFNAQLSYVFPSNWELSGRFATVQPERQLSEFTPTQDEYLLGITKYIKRHRVKVQFNTGYNRFSKVPDHLSAGTNDHWIAIFQVEFGI